MRWTKDRRRRARGSERAGLAGARGVRWTVLLVTSIMTILRPHYDLTERVRKLEGRLEG